MKMLFRYCLIISSFSFLFSYLFFNGINNSANASDELLGLKYCSENKEFNNVIAIGGSRVLTHIDPLILDSIIGLKSQNVSIVDIGIVEYNMLFRKYLQVHPKPNYIILNIDFNMFYTNGPLYNITDFFPYLSDTLISNCLSPYKLAYRNRFVQYFYILEKVFAITDQSKSQFVFNTPETDSEDNQNYGKGFVPRMKDWSPGASAEIKNKTTATYQEEGFQILKSIIGRCKKDSINLICIYSPIYTEGKFHVSNFDEIFKKVRAILDETSTPFWDYSNLEICNSTEYFYNYNHLNYKGAKIFSTQLAMDIKKFIDKKI